jgi:hypothetical protein
MPELDADIAELQRRAYGPGGNDLSPAERARLAQLEASTRAADPPVAPAPEIPGSEHPAHSAPSPGDPPSGQSNASAGRAGGPSGHLSGDPGAPVPAPGQWIQTASSLGRGNPAAEPEWIRDESGERDRIRGASARRGRRWFTPALIAAIGVSAAIVRLVAGGVGWGGGYAAGVTRHAGPGGGAEFVIELHPTEMPERFAERSGGYAFMEVDTETGALVAQGTYYGSIGFPSDTVCLNVTQIIQETEDTWTFAGDSACGPPQLDVSVDLFTGVDDEEYPTGMRLATDAYPQDTLLRFTYSAASDSVTVWSLAPSE